MSLIVIDHGNRIETPVKSLFPARGVEQTSPTKAIHDSAGLEKRVHADGESFTNILKHETKQPLKDSSSQTNNPNNPYSTDDTYSAINPEKLKPRANRLKVAQVMSHPVHTIAREVTFNTAWKRMQELHVSHLMVTGNNGEPVGIISHIDIIEHGKESPVSIANYYTKQLIAASPDTDISVISSSFIEYEINAMPVFDSNNQLLGIVCRSDLLRLLISGSHIESWA
ncbi:CBS domain-containing protein [Neptunomonas qingdaonensis]|uniref:CBS domain-containing protein n=1 Tax=Neptunomonas qingdaonensis TaxID=1045558 RepID=A0A1I2MXI2_9GAMM|nr:CBS domain-containing protein [Neptunomonas qingdaonensis]SFF96305.1 CBS domain-containing protein [Neptunomonas qingdaonensis]